MTQYTSLMYLGFVRRFLFFFMYWHLNLLRGDLWMWILDVFPFFMFLWFFLLIKNIFSLGPPQSKLTPMANCGLWIDKLSDASFWNRRSRKERCTSNSWIRFRCWALYKWVFLFKYIRNFVRTQFVRRKIIKWIFKKISQIISIEL